MIITGIITLKKSFRGAITSGHKAKNNSLYNREL